MAERLTPVEGAEIKRCPEPGCSATMAGPGRIVAHHDDGSHTMDWGGDVPHLAEQPGAPNALMKGRG